MTLIEKVSKGCALQLIGGNNRIYTLGFVSKSVFCFFFITWKNFLLNTLLKDRNLMEANCKGYV